MGGRRDDDEARGRPEAAGPTPSLARMAPLAAGFVLALLATLAIFLTDDATYLRLAVLGAAWAFVLAAFVAGRRRTDQAAAAARETELRRAYERELEREEATHREIELELENDLRRDVQEAMRDELEALRRDVAALSGLRRELGGLAGLPQQLAALSALRDELARMSTLRADVEALGRVRSEMEALGSLRDEVGALRRLRDELGPLAELRTELGRLRADISEQLSGELLVERIVMRTQAGRATDEPTDGPSAQRAVDGPGWWLGAGEHDRVSAGRPWAESVPSWTAPAETVAQWTETTEPAEPWAASAELWAAPVDPSPQAAAFPGLPSTPEPFSRPPMPPMPPMWRAEPAAGPSTAPEPAARGGDSDRPLSPLDRPAAPSVIDPPADLRPRHSRRAADRAAEPAPLAPDPDALTTERPRPQPIPRYDHALPPNENVRRAPEPRVAEVRVPETGPLFPSTPASRAVQLPVEQPPAAPTREHVYVQEILAEQGTPPPNGRRRRRYRDENTEDDVLSRVLGRD